MYEATGYKWKQAAHGRHDCEEKASMRMQRAHKLRESSTTTVYISGKVEDFIMDGISTQ